MGEGERLRDGRGVLVLNPPPLPFAVLCPWGAGGTAGPHPWSCLTGFGFWFIVLPGVRVSGLECWHKKENLCLPTAWLLPACFALTLFSLAQGSRKVTPNIQPQPQPTR